MVMGGALLASVLSVAALMRVTAQPRLASSLQPSSATPLLSVVTPDGVVVLTTGGGYRVRSTLAVEPIAWSEYGKIIAVRSAAWWNGKLAVLASVERDGSPEPDVLVVEGNELSPQARGSHNVFGMAAGPDGLSLYLHYEGHAMRAPLAGGGLSKGPEVPSDALEGVITLDDKPYLLIGERGAHWLLDWQRTLHPMPEGAFAVWSSTLLRPPLSTASRVPFLDSHGHTHVYAPAGPPILRVEDGKLAPLAVTRSLDEPGVIVTSLGDERVEVHHVNRRVYVASSGRPAWRAVATSMAPYDFHAVPLGDRWLLLGDHGFEAVALDANLQRLDAGEPMFVALTSQPIGVWLALMSLLGLFVAALPFAIRRAAAMLRLAEDRSALFLGALKLPPGAVGATGRTGRVNLAGDCHLRAGNRTYDLSPGPLRADSGAPLCDGDLVYVVGRVETDHQGGPWRASQRERIVPQNGRYLIGRGDRDDFVYQLTARANARLLAFALAHLTLAMGILGFLGLRPFI
jgi:hypothetical protein